MYNVKIHTKSDYTRVFQGGYIYSRMNNYTCDSVQCAINAIEGGEGTLVFTTGMASITTALFCFLKSGDHIVSLLVTHAGYSDTLDAGRTGERRVNRYLIVYIKSHEIEHNRPRSEDTVTAGLKATNTSQWQQCPHSAVCCVKLHDF